MAGLFGYAYVEWRVCDERYMYLSTISTTFVHSPSEAVCSSSPVKHPLLELQRGHNASPALAQLGWWALYVFLLLWVMGVVCVFIVVGDGRCMCFYCCG
jgi:hypothetical protein